MKELRNERIFHSFQYFRAIFYPRAVFLLGFILFISIFFSACDNDERFAIKTSETLLLMQKDSSSEKQLLSYLSDATTIKPKFLWNVSNLTDLDGRANQFCYGKLDENQLYYECNNVKENRSSGKGIGHNTKEYSPHYVALGEIYVVFSDTLLNKIGFIKKNKNEDPIIREVAHKPLQITYAFGKFYVVYDNHTLGIWDEKALSERNVVNLKGTFLNAAQNVNTMEIFTQSNDSVFQNVVEFETDFLNTVKVSDFQEIQYSPYNRIEYGNEWLQNPALLKNGKLLLDKDSKEVLADSVTSFAIDFSQSIVYYIRNNQLLVQKMGSSTILASTPFKGKILKSFFQQGYSK